MPTDEQIGNEELEKGLQQGRDLAGPPKNTIRVQLTMDGDHPMVHRFACPMSDTAALEDLIRQVVELIRDVTPSP